MAQQKKTNAKNKTTGSKTAYKNNKKNTSGTKKQTASKSSPKKAAPKSEPKPQPQPKPEPTQEELMLHGEMAAIAMMGLSLILLICVLASERMGFVGGYISAGIKHTLGIGGLAIPIVFLAFGFQLFRHKCSCSEFKRRTLLFSGFLLAFISIAHVLTYKNGSVLTFAGYVSECFDNGSLTNGGLVGALIGGGLSKIIGTVGAYILLVVALVILFITATGKSVSAFFGMIGDAIDGIKREDEYEYEDDYDYEYAQDTPKPSSQEEVKSKQNTQAEDKPEQAAIDDYTEDNKADGIKAESQSSGIKIEVRQKPKPQPQPAKKSFSIFDIFKSKDTADEQPQAFTPRFPVDIPMGETDTSKDEEITIENFIVNENHKFIKRTLRVPDYVPHLSDKIEKAKADMKNGTQVSDISVNDDTHYDPEILFRDIEGADDEYNLNEITINGEKQRFDEFKDSLAGAKASDKSEQEDNSPVDIALGGKMPTAPIHNEPVTVKNETDNNTSVGSNMSIHIVEEPTTAEDNYNEAVSTTDNSLSNRNLNIEETAASDNVGNIDSDISAEQNDEEARAILEALNSLENSSDNSTSLRPNYPNRQAPVQQPYSNQPVQQTSSVRQSAPVQRCSVQPSVQPKAYSQPYSEDNAPLIIEAEKERNVKTLATEKVKTEYKFPKLDFLSKCQPGSGIDKREMYEKAKKLENTLSIFGIDAKVNNISQGPAVTRYELTPPEGVKVSKIESLENDIMLALAANSIRMEVPIPGKSAIGIEIPNDSIHSVFFSEILMSEKFNNFKSRLAFGLGKDITGNVIVTDIAKMPHLLIAGATGSGKSVCVNTMLTSILYKSTPDEVKLILIDPKVVELSVYNGIPHLLIPVVTDPHKAAGALNWAVREMMRRYDLFASTGTRKLEGYNEKVPKEEKLPQILVVIDELADLMIAAKKEVESSIQRLTQLARAAGIHLIIATQRPSVDVITGVIKANVPSRIAFKVSSTTDSRTILDVGGAEKLLGKGDMLFKAVDMDKALRIQGAFVSDEEVERIVNYIKVDESNYDQSIMQELERAADGDDSPSAGSSSAADSDDSLINDVISFVVHSKKASISSIQRKFRIGYNRAANIMDELEDRGIVGSDHGGTKGREVLMDKHELREWTERQSDY